MRRFFRGIGNFLVSLLINMVLRWELMLLTIGMFLVCTFFKIPMFLFWIVCGVWALVSAVVTALMTFAGSAVEADKKQRYATGRNPMKDKKFEEAWTCECGETENFGLYCKKCKKIVPFEKAKRG